MSFALLFLLACVHHVEPQAPAAFSCDHQSYPRPALSDAPAAQLELELGPLPAAPPPDPGAAPDPLIEEARIRRHFGSVTVHAVFEDAPIEEVALQLGELLELPVGLDPRLRGTRITGALEQGDFEDLVTLLRETMGVWIGFPRGVLALEADLTYRHRAMASEGGGRRMQTYIVPIQYGDARAIAEAACGCCVSHAGHLTVVGDSLVVKDQESSIASVRELVRHLDVEPGVEGEDE
jgi:hypothetical protein